MPVTRTITGEINMDLLERSPIGAGFNSGVEVNGQDVTFTDIDDEALADAAIAFYNSAVAERTQIMNALAANDAFVAIANPNTAQNAAQIKALTRQINGLARILINRGLLG